MYGNRVLATTGAKSKLAYHILNVLINDTAYDIEKKNKQVKIALMTTKILLISIKETIGIIYKNGNLNWLMEKLN